MSRRFNAWCGGSLLKVLVFSTMSIFRVSLTSSMDRLSHGGGSRDLLVQENMDRLITITKSD
jgi:hypothetical protein